MAASRQGRTLARPAGLRKERVTGYGPLSVPGVVSLREAALHQGVEDGHSM